MVREQWLVHNPQVAGFALWVKDCKAILPNRSDFSSSRSRAAKAARDAAEARHEAVATQAEARLKALYERFRLLSSTLATRQTAHASDNYPQLIEKAIKGGELTAIDALLALSEWYALSDNLTTLKYEVAQAGAAMALCLL